jgi:hypothetical protein
MVTNRPFGIIIVADFRNSLEIPERQTSESLVKGGLAMRRPLADRLINLCVRNAEQIAEHWYQALTVNSRTQSYNSVAKATCLRLANSMYKNLGNMYFAENTFQAVEQNLDMAGFAEDQFARSIPLEEVIYALILMRREIWFHSEQQSLFNIPEDMYELVVSVNRVLLLFDYTTYIVATKYRDMSGKVGKAHTK